MLLFALLLVGVVACDDDEDDMIIPEIPTTGMSNTFTLNAVDNPSISGTAKLEELEDGTSKLTLDLNGTSSGNMHPAHIHFNTAAEGGGIAVSLSAVDGATGMSETIISALDDGTAITYNQLLNFDGYINVHQSVSDLATLVAQGDIGQNALTGDMMNYDLASVADPNISGTATFAKRMNNETLVTLALTGTPDGSMHPAHIHFNTAAEGGGIAVSLGAVDGTSGMKKTNVAMLDDGTAITYDELINYDGYINVHLSAEDLATLVAQGDIGQNALTGDMMNYDLASVADPNISGTATFAKRMNNETLVTLALTGTPDGSMHPAHIHFNTAAEGGGIAVSLGAVDGTSGMKKTNVAMLDDGTAITYDELINYDGYINVHLSAEDLATLVAQGDIGQNALTGESVTYDLGEKDVTGISGTITFSQRMNGESLAVIELIGITEGNHPAHIHAGSVAEAPGGILISLTPVNAMGMSKTNIAMNDAEETISYEALTNIDGYVNVHASAEDLATLLAQGNVGSNAVE